MVYLFSIIYCIFLIAFINFCYIDLKERINRLQNYFLPTVEVDCKEGECF